MAQGNAIPEGWVREVQRLLAPVDEPRNGPRRPGLAREILAFVLTGEPLSVLHEIAQNEIVGRQLKLLVDHFPRDSSVHEELGELYKQFNRLPDAIALRWARVLEASATPAKAHFRIPLRRAVSWPEALLVNTSGQYMNGYTSPRPKARWLSAQQVESLLTEDGLEPSALLGSKCCNCSSLLIPPRWTSWLPGHVRSA